jgi:hypothetical protein
VTRAIVAAQSQESRDYARLLVEIEIRKRRLALLDAERGALERALSKFAVDLKGRVGGIRAELKRVRLQIAEYRRRIERLKGDETLDPATVEREVAEEFAERIRAGEASEEASRREGATIDRPRRSHRLDAETEAEIVRVYRALAKRFHPDLAKNERERARRTEFMLRINVAYSERDLLLLQTIAKDAEADEPGAPSLSEAERVSWAHRVIARLDMQVADLEAQLNLLRQSETYTLWHSPDSSQQSLVDLEARVRERLTRERDRLDEAIIDYNRLARRRKLSRASAASYANR